MKTKKRKRNTIIIKRCKNYGSNKIWLPFEMKSKTQEPQELNKNNKKKKKKNNMERQQANKNTFYNANFTSSPKFLEDFFRNAP